MLSYELEKMVLQYINCEITIEQLEDWLVPRLPVFLRLPHSSDSDVVAAIELGLAEMSDEIRNEAEFREFLSDVLREHSTTRVICPPEQLYSTATSSNNKVMSPILLSPSAEFAMMVIDQQSYGST
jgi:hypothetical protein